MVSSKWRRCPVIEMMTRWVCAHSLRTQGVGGHVGRERRSWAARLHVLLIWGHHVAIEEVWCHGQLLVRAANRGPVVWMHHCCSMVMMVSIHGHHAVRRTEVRIEEVRMGLWWHMRWRRHGCLVLLEVVIASPSRTSDCV